MRNMPGCILLFVTVAFRPVAFVPEVGVMADTVENRAAQGSAGSVEGADRQDIRVAVVMNGGVSLAVWISGVTLELYRVVTARGGTGSAYTPLLDLLHADAHVDVIAGTSAGGLNGAFLALGLARHRDVALLRDLWHEHGSLDKLLRDPLARNPKSLLMGDEYFLVKVREALEKVAGSSSLPSDQADGELPPVELLLTGTLWRGRSTAFTDDMGTGITEKDHDATFRFTNHRASSRNGSPVSGDLTADTVLDELASAARCTSSFPGAFEPHFVQVSSGDRGGDLRWGSTAGRTNFREEQYVVDGGVLLNKPIRPVLQAVYQQTAGFQVRRVLAYVVPDPGEPLQPSSAEAAGAGPQAGATTPRSEVPSAGEVLLGVLTRLRSTDSVSRELTEIRSRNTDVRTRRRARDRFATAMTGVADQLSGQAWRGYREVRVDNAARTIAPLLAAAGQRGQPTGHWSEQELLGVLRRLPMPFVPANSIGEALVRVDESWDWGQTTVQRLADLTIDLLKRAVWLASVGSDHRTAIVACRKSVAATLQQIRSARQTINCHWSTAPDGSDVGPMPARRGSPNQAADNLPELEEWLKAALKASENRPTPGDVGWRTCLYRQALELARHLCSVAPAVQAISAAGNRALDPDSEWADGLAALHKFLFMADSDIIVAAETVLQNMLRLDVVQLAFTGASREPEQEVELVQVSSLQPERLTGIQLHHFGAFYRGSWRMNDWLQGRMDAVAQLVRILLSPERLRQCLLEADSRPGPVDQDADTEATEKLLEKIQQLAVPEQSPDKAWLAEQWARDRTACAQEVKRIVTGGDLPSLDSCARAIARPIRISVLRDDLGSLAEAIRAEGSDRAEDGTTWLAFFDSAGVAADGKLSADDLWCLWEKAEKVGGERIKNEVGGDTFARTVSRAATVVANTAGSAVKIKPLAAVLSAFRGYALAVWAMVALLTRSSGVGTRAVEIALASGGVLLTVALLVPTVPIGLTLIGVLLLLAGFTSAALLSPETRPVGRRLAAATLVVLLALAGYLWWDWSRNGSAELAQSLSIKLGVVLLVVLLGWWVAGAKPRRSARTQGIGRTASPEQRRDQSSRGTV